MNTTEYYIPAKGPEDFYAYRLGLQVQAYGGVIIIVFGIVGKQHIWFGPNAKGSYQSLP